MPEGSRPPLLPPAVAVAAVLALVGAGCLGARHEGSDPGAPFAESETAYSPSAFPPGSDWVVIGVESPGKLPVPRLQAELVSHEAAGPTSPDDYLEPYRHPCMVVDGVSDAGIGSGVVGVNPGIYQGMRYRGPLGERNVGGVSNVHDSVNLDLALPFVDGSARQGYLLVGLSTVHDLGPEESLRLTLTSDVPFRSSVVASGTMECVPGPDGFQEGDFTQLGLTAGSGYFEATGLRSSLDAGGPAYLAVFADANQALTASVSEDGAVVWDQDSPAPADDLVDWWISRPGRWEVRIDEARDLDGFPFTAYVFVKGLPQGLAPMLAAAAPPPRTAP